MLMFCAIVAHRRAYDDSLKLAFVKVVLDDQDVFRTDPQQWENMLQMLPDRGASAASLPSKTRALTCFPRAPAENAASLLKEFGNDAKKSSAERWANVVKIPPSAPAASNANKLRVRLLSHPVSSSSRPSN